MNKTFRSGRNAHAWAATCAPVCFLGVFDSAWSARRRRPAALAVESRPIAHRPRYFVFARVLRFGGTFAPERRASERPMAIACLRLFTFFFERPLRSEPLLRSCRARLTLLPAFFP
jgi:hypothetical protein